jgi:hypothetical protein
MLDRRRPQRSSVDDPDAHPRTVGDALMAELDHGSKW